MIATIIFLSTPQVLAIHDQMIKRFGGSPGLREISLLESAVGRPESTYDGEYLYETIFDKAAALLKSLLKNHPFVDGNKRTALTCAGIFLKINGYKLINSHKEEEDFALNVDNQKLSVEEIGEWLKNHSMQIEDAE